MSPLEAGSRLRALPSGRVAFALLAGGWGCAALAARLGAFNQEVAASFAAFWLVAVLFAVSAWDLLLTILLHLRNPSLELAEEQELPPWMRPLASWLIPLGVVAGALFGHLVWH